jgi:hypothetical protein
MTTKNVKTEPFINTYELGYNTAIINAVIWLYNTNQHGDRIKGTKLTCPALFVLNEFGCKLAVLYCNHFCPTLYKIDKINQRFLKTVMGLT